MTKPTIIGLAFLAAVIAAAGGIAAVSTTRVPVPTRVSPKLYTPSSSLPVLAERMPPFIGITKWWNTPGGQALSPESLKGKVVLVDFWTYSCINCIRTYPFLRSIYEKYADKGLVIVGVHTPEFAFEKDPKNVGDEIAKNGIAYPVALDPEYGTWNAYANNSWPAEYLFDRQGRLRRAHFGEGAYDESESAIRDLLMEAPDIQLGQAGNAGSMPDFSKIQTEETYFGLGRGDAFMGTAGRAGTDVTYPASSAVLPNQWTAGGTWQFQNEYVESRSAGNVFRFNVNASKLHIVLESADGTDKTLEIFVDGKKERELTINRSALYTIADFPGAGRHTVEIRIKDAGVRFYAATFS